MSLSAVSMLLSALLLCSVTFVPARSTNTAPSPWKTLSGDPPLVVARGGFSGLFPDSSTAAYQLALAISVPNVVLWCDVQLTKDRVGICFPDLRLDSASDVMDVFPDRKKSYLVDGVPEEGYFAVDFTSTELLNITLLQAMDRRSYRFDYLYGIQTVKQVMLIQPATILWLNVQHEAFYARHNLRMTDFLSSVPSKGSVAYVSSPEIAFLRGISAKFAKTKTKLVFRFLSPDEFEPTTNRTYGSLLKNLTYIAEFASGILIPKSYVWPDEGSGYLLPHTHLVTDAHGIRLEVYAADFVNDLPLSYNYSFDPIVEYLQYVDNGEFSVDGVVSDFPITPSAAIECYAHLNKSDPGKDTPLVISYYGASGDYPPCTDVAYAKAVTDGANIIDCPVHMSKDRIPFCLSSANLIDSTTILSSNYSSLMTKVPEIQSDDGIFSFKLTAAQIQSLTPQILNPFKNFKRNPKYSHEGRLVKLSDFLTSAKDATSVSGVSISIENAAYLATRGLDVIGAVFNALTNAGYDNLTTKRVLIQSSESSVLVKVKDTSKYERVYEVVEDIRGVVGTAVVDIKEFADSVMLTKESVFPLNQAMILENATRVVEKFHASKMLVYVKEFSNEFISQAYDFVSDPTMEINSFVMTGRIDGVVTGFPKTAASYKRNRCLVGENIPPYMSTVTPGELLTDVSSQPPAEAPLPLLIPSDVIEPPIPAISPRADAPSSSPGSVPGEGNTTTVTAPPPNSQPKIAAPRYSSTLAALVLAITTLIYEAV